ncbi:caspase family protein [Chitinophaga sp. sic0106]|uniref:caspase family protein n=1 Tax=Chitinophaga sp. sic0106 TaxID=2854785 RepID=UPI001C45047A|nr:caspase family protein [Chitinophaga sp. sic0106]MBV7533824.1 caspase family protein [Chitinophaga sp. sic0106]
MNIAIIIGVSEYQNPKNNLPGCKNDAKLIYEILSHTEKFDPILYINNNEDSSKTKELINNFIDSHLGKKIDDLFFYYSGHGEFSNNEFYYVLSDFDFKKRNQTSLQNKDIDDLFKSLNPNLVVKVVDACQSGTTYIKENDAMAKYFRDSGTGYHNCYFLSSSLNNQSSYQTSFISAFTESFVKALIVSTTQDIRYKGIIDVILDDFIDNADQTPFYVIQGVLTHIFCRINTNLRNYLDSIKPQILIDPSSAKPALTLLELVKKDAKDYTSKEGAIQTLDFVKKILSSLTLGPDLDSIYAVEVSFLQDYDFTPKKWIIERWINEQTNDYSTHVYYHTVYDEDHGEYEEIAGFELNVEPPFKTISIDILGKYPNLTSYNCHIMYLLTKKYIRFFFNIAEYLQKNWENKRLNISGSKWRTVEQIITDKDGITKSLDDIKQNIQNLIMETLEAKFKLNDATHVSETTEIGEPNQNANISDDDLPF